MYHSWYCVRGREGRADFIMLTYTHVLIGLSIFVPEERGSRHRVPLLEFRRGYLWVSDLSSQMWCEQQLHYKFTSPLVVPEAPQLTKGTELHLAREMETQDYVDVTVESSEDIFGVKILNLLKCVLDFKLGVKTVNREIPIFGFYEGTFFLGKIDELLFNIEDYKLSIVEFKTRMRKCLPSRPQKLTHAIQVMTYKFMFDNLCTGQLDVKAIWSTLQLDPKRRFGTDFQQHVDPISSQIRTLEELIAKLIESASGLPLVSELCVEYTFQGDGQSFAKETIDYDEDWLMRKVHGYLGYWEGSRAPEGVQVEEAWKCGNCDYYEECSWRKKKSEECCSKSESA